MSAFSLADYHTAERNAGVALVFLGVASATWAAWIVRARGPLTAMAWPLALGALVQLSVGTGMAFNAHRELRQELPVNAETVTALAAKLAKQARDYGVATRIELGLVIVATVLSLGFPRPRTARALLLGLLVECVALLCFDTFGLSRATQGLDHLTASVH